MEYPAFCSFRFHYRHFCQEPQINVHEVFKTEGKQMSYLLGFPCFKGYTDSLEDNLEFCNNILSSCET